MEKRGRITWGNFATRTFQLLKSYTELERKHRCFVAMEMLQLHSAATLALLQSPPGNRFEALKGDHAGQYSIRINDQWRVCFRWADGDAFDVEIVDYH